MPRDSHAVLERRNRKAQREGWKSYRQKRYWLEEFAASPVATRNRLARKIAPATPAEHGRPRSMFNKTVDLIVNGEGGGKSGKPPRYSPLRERLGIGDGGSRWEARLVRAAVDGLRA